MLKNIITILILMIFTACVNNEVKIPTDTNLISNKITINIDEELKLLDITGLRDDSLKVIEEPIYIGDNDEVSFKGDMMQKKSPLLIQIGERKPIKFSGNNYTVKTMELKNGDLITIKDKRGNVFVEVNIIK